MCGRRKTGVGDASHRVTADTMGPECVAELRVSGLGF